MGKIQKIISKGNSQYKWEKVIQNHLKVFLAKCFDTNAENVATECCVQFIRLEFQKVHLDRSQNNYQSPLEQFNSILASPVVFISPARETDGVWKDFSATAAAAKQKMDDSPEFDVPESQNWRQLGDLPPSILIGCREVTSANFLSSPWLRG